MKAPLLAFLLLPALAYSQSTPPPAPTGEWKRLELTNEFWAEGACAADVDKDGHVDVLSGPYWYSGPAFKERHLIYPAEAKFTAKNDDGTTRELPGFEGALGTENKYSDNFLSYAADFNRDGSPDYLVCGFPGKETWWFENPKGATGLWKKHVALAVTDNESPMFVDVTGDGQPELLCMSVGFIGYAEPDAAKPDEPWRWHAISTKGPYQRFTHGIGAGDVNGDGRIDILETRGWWEHPAQLTDAPWTFHEAPFGKSGAQMFVLDVNGDGKPDVLTALEAHGYGVAWFEQTADGWTKHLIVGTPQEPGETGLVFSQPHALDLADMNCDGIPDLITGKRYWAHGRDKDPEPMAPKVLWWLELQRAKGTAKWIPHFIDGDSGIGTQVIAVDLNADGKLDVLVGNKKGVFVHVRQ